MTQVEHIPLMPRPAAEPSIKVSRPATRLEWERLFQDFYQSTKAYGFWLYSAWLEILLNYRSTMLGPLWIVVGTGVFVITVGTLYNRVILAGGSNIYLAHLAVGMTLWFVIIQSIVKSATLFVENRAVLLDGAITYTDLLLKLLMTNLILFAHNAVIVVLVFVWLRLLPGFLGIDHFADVSARPGQHSLDVRRRIDPRNTLCRSRRAASLHASFGFLHHADPLDTASRCARPVCRRPHLLEPVLLFRRSGT